MAAAAMMSPGLSGEAQQRAAGVARGKTTVKSSQVRAAVDAAVSIASEFGLRADDSVVLQNSNRLLLRLTPCDLVARIVTVEHQAKAEFEVEVALQLAAIGSSVVALEPRVEPSVYVRDGFAINLWTYVAQVQNPGPSSARYANALTQLHAGLRTLKVTAPHFTDRVAEAQALVGNPSITPALADADRELLQNTLLNMRTSIASRCAREQLLHGEPHPGNVLNSANGLLFLDFETCCRGPIEFDIAHMPVEVSAHYPGVDPALLDECRILVLAMVAAWRWDRNDQYPQGHQMGQELLSQIRATLA